MFSRCLFFSTIWLSSKQKVRRALLACWSHQTVNEWWITFGSRFPFPLDPNTQPQYASLLFVLWLVDGFKCVWFCITRSFISFVPILTPTETKFGFWSPPKTTLPNRQSVNRPLHFPHQFPPDASKIAASFRLSQKRNYHPWIKIMGVDPFLDCRKNSRVSRFYSRTSSCRDTGTSSPLFIYWQFSHFVPRKLLFVSFALQFLTVTAVCVE